MHGFVNVFVAALFAQLRAEQRVLVDILNEADPSAFRFLDGEMLCRGLGIGTAQIAEARHDFAHSFGSCLEITSRGAEPIALSSGEMRSFLEDGDEVVLRAFCQTPGFRRIGLGECRGVVLPAHAAVSRL